MNTLTGSGIVVVAVTVPEERNYVARVLPLLLLLTLARNGEFYQVFIQLAGKGLQIIGSIKCKL